MRNEREASGRRLAGLAGYLFPRLEVLVNALATQRCQAGISSKPSHTPVPCPWLKLMVWPTQIVGPWIVGSIILAWAPGCGRGRKRHHRRSDVNFNIPRRPWCSPVLVEPGVGWVGETCSLPREIGLLAMGASLSLPWKCGLFEGSTFRPAPSRNLSHSTWCTRGGACDGPWQAVYRR